MNDASSFLEKVITKFIHLENIYNKLSVDSNLFWTRFGSNQVSPVVVRLSFV